MEKLEAVAIPADASYRAWCPMRFGWTVRNGGDVEPQKDGCQGPRCAWWLWLEKPPDPKEGRGLCGGSPAVAALIGFAGGAAGLSRGITG